MAIVPQIAINRIAAVRNSMKEMDVDAMIVSHYPSMRYLVNFSGSNGVLVILPNALYFITDDRYTQQISTECFEFPDLNMFIDRDFVEVMKVHGFFTNVKKVGFQSNKMSVDEYNNYTKNFSDLEFVPVKNVVEKATWAKSEDELALMKMAATITSEVYMQVLPLIKPGVTEHELATEISYQMRKRGAVDEAFDIIVVSGVRSAWVHGRASQKVIEQGDVITFDFGCNYQGFNSDMTRTVVVGKATEEQKKVFSTIRKAYDESVQASKAGMKASEIDMIARTIITDAGYGDYFKHSLGHGLGIEVHETPGISFRNVDDVLVENCVITIEPGIYLPEKFGMRLEDDIVITKSEPILLTSAPRDFFEL
jgi:Xaa-Pro aminopeptidase